MTYLDTVREFHYDFVYMTANPEDGLFEEVMYLDSLDPLTEERIKEVWEELEKENSFHFQPVALNIHCPGQVESEF